jgi:hypothetical protein
MAGRTRARTRTLTHARCLPPVCPHTHTHTHTTWMPTPPLSLSLSPHPTPAHAGQRSRAMSRRKFLSLSTYVPQEDHLIPQVGNVQFSQGGGGPESCGKWLVG